MLGVAAQAGLFKQLLGTLPGADTSHMRAAKRGFSRKVKWG